AALGQKQTCALQKAMSALPPIATAKADFPQKSCLLYPRKRTCAVHQTMSALGQKRTSLVLFDYLVGTVEQRRWDREAERLGGFEIDHQLVFRRSLHGKISRFFALKDAINVRCASPVQVQGVKTVGHQAPACCVMPKWINGGQAIADRQRKNPIAGVVVHGGGQHNQAAPGLLREHTNRGLDIVARVVKDESCHLHSETLRQALDHAPHPSKSREGGVQNACYTLQARLNLFQQFHPFAADFGFECTEPSNVALRVREILDKPCVDRIGHDNEYDWDAAGRSLQCR